MTGLAADAELAGELVRSAGALALRMRSGDLSVERKTSVSDLVTAADRAAEELIVERLAAERPDDGVVAEEGSTRPTTSGRTWVIDPVDGTWNYAHGLDWWCSAIALTDADDVLVGAVFHATAGRLYVGGPGIGATCDGKPLPTLPDRPLAESGVATYLHPPFQEGPVRDAWTRVSRGAATLRMMGSGSVDLMAVACGRVGLSFQHTVPDWDRLPGAAIVRGVGGESRRTRAGGVEWTVTGAPTAVAEACAALGAG